MKTSSVCLIIPDLHLPFQHPEAFNFLKALKKKYRPTKIVCIGDIIDSYALSQFVKSPSSSNVNQELYKAQNGIKELARIFPVMLVCLGNHDLRLLKLAEKAGIPGEYLKSLPELLGTPQGWKFQDSFDIDGVHYFHGDGYTGLNACQNVIKTKFRNTVFGHTHQASILYLNGLWSFNTGCLINKSAYAFQYAKHFKNEPALGAGLVDSGVPYFIPL